MASIFITGHSHGLGLGLTRFYLDQGKQVYGLSRSACRLQSPSLSQRQADLARLDALPARLQDWLPPRLDQVILNAGILGDIKDLSDTSLDEINTIMDINVWANKLVIDWLIKHNVEVQQLVLISSGASVNGNRGWGAYSLSKATLNMLARLYAQEMPATHITALAPGLVHTRMQDYLCNEVDTAKFPSINNLVKAMDSGMMPTVDEAAAAIAGALPRCLDFESGSFVDIRQL